MQAISRADAVSAIKKSNGKFFRVEFVRRNHKPGESWLRKMVARLGVTKHLKGGTLRYKPEQAGLIIAYDTEKKDYRAIPTDNLVAIKINGKEYQVK